MDIQVEPEEAKRALDRLDALLHVFQLTRANELIDAIGPYWSGQKAEAFRRKIEELQAQLAANIGLANEFHAQAISYVRDLLGLDENA